MTLGLVFPLIPGRSLSPYPLPSSDLAKEPFRTVILGVLGDLDSDDIDFGLLRDGEERVREVSRGRLEGANSS